MPQVTLRFHHSLWPERSRAVGESRAVKKYLSFRINEVSPWCAWLCSPGVYPLGMKHETVETIERLIRVRAVRRGLPVELRVHYERASTTDGCETYQLFVVEDMESAAAR